MNKKLLLVATVSVLAFATVACAQYGGWGHRGGGYGHNNGGHYGMNGGYGHYGMMGGMNGGMMRGGMMNGYNNGCGYGGNYGMGGGMYNAPYGGQYNGPATLEFKAITQDEAKTAVQKYITDSGIKGYKITGMETLPSQRPDVNFYEASVTDNSGNLFKYRVSPFGIIDGPFLANKK